MTTLVRIDGGAVAAVDVPSEPVEVTSAKKPSALTDPSDVNSIVRLGTDEVSVVPTPLLPLNRPSRGLLVLVPSYTVSQSYDCSVFI
jgi:hypothetical protein